MINRRKSIGNWLYKTGLFNPADNIQLVLFRIFFGLLLSAECIAALCTGWVQEHLSDPTFTFSYIGFEWLQPLPGNGMYFYYAIMSAAALLMALGLYYRVASLLFFILWTLAYLMQKTEYNNHYYLVLLISMILLFVPAADDLSMDSRRKRSRRKACPRWCVFLFQFQVFIVYFYAGIHKLSPDWLQGLPLQVAFDTRAEESSFVTYLNTPLIRSLITYGGIFFDLLIVPCLLFAPARVYGWGCLLLFHLFNFVVFRIAVFPFLMIALSVFFIPAEKIRAVIFREEEEVFPERNSGYDFAFNKLWISPLIGVYMLLQIILPLRCHFYPGNTDWTEEGHRLSWRMMLRMKSGTIYFKVKDAAGSTWLVQPEKYLTISQSAALATHPDMIWQFARYLEKDFRNRGKEIREIYAYSRVSLNGRPDKLFIDTTVNFAKTPWHCFRHSGWILPMEKESEKLEGGK